MSPYTYNLRIRILLPVVVFSILAIIVPMFGNSLIPAAASVHLVGKQGKTGAATQNPLKCKPPRCPPPTPTPTHTPTPTPTFTPTPTPTPTFTPTPTATSTPGTTPTTTSNSTPGTTPTSLPTATPTTSRTPIFNPGASPTPAFTPTSPTTQTSGNQPPSGGNGNTSGGAINGNLFTLAALLLATLAFLLYLIPQQQSSPSLATKLLSLILPAALLRRFGNNSQAKNIGQ